MEKCRPTAFGVCEVDQGKPHGTASARQTKVAAVLRMVEREVLMVGEGWWKK